MFQYPVALQPVSNREDFLLTLQVWDDDAGQLAALVRQAFPTPGHRIEVARTGAAGVAHVRAAPPDVILLNLELPDQRGLAVYQQIRPSRPRSPAGAVLPLERLHHPPAALARAGRRPAAAGAASRAAILPRDRTRDLRR